MIGTGAIILAAGSGSRMGRAKQLLKIDGQSLVRRAARAALDGGVERVVIVTGAYPQEVAAELAGLAVSVSFNPFWSKGMGTSIRCGLAALLKIDPKLAAVVVVVCDQPRLGAEVIGDLLEVWAKSGKMMGACEYGRTVGPPCCFDKSMFDALGRIGDAEGAKGLLLRDAGAVATIPWPAGAEDLDTPGDLEKFGI